MGTMTEVKWQLTTVMALFVINLIIFLFNITFLLYLLFPCRWCHLPSKQPATCCKWCIRTPNAGPTPFRHFPVWAVCACSYSCLLHSFCKQEMLLSRCMNVPSTVIGEFCTSALQLLISVFLSLMFMVLFFFQVYFCSEPVWARQYKLHRVGYISGLAFVSCWAVWT